MDITPIDILLKKFEDQTLTKEESMRLWQMLEQNPNSVETVIFKRSLLHQHTNAELSNIDWNKTLETILNVDKPVAMSVKRPKIWLRWAVAAGLLIAAAR
ncbi:hypothetical protein [Pedobacter sp.]|uniref:hypothetical protein n=1 Tax=Pedobacter sp. TaxID=1411316 RepID=UPI003BAB4DF6